MIPHAIRLLLLFLSLTGLGSLSLSAQAELEYEVKAAFLYNFIRFIDWPEEAFSGPDAPLVIGVLGRTDPFRGQLQEAVAGKTANGRPLEIRTGRSLEEIGPVHLLFIGPFENVPAALAKLRGQPVVTVGDRQDFTAAGGMIRFFLREQRVAFEINLDAVEEAELRMSSRLLALADIYRSPSRRTQ